MAISNLAHEFNGTTGTQPTAQQAVTIGSGVLGVAQNAAQRAAAAARVRQSGVTGGGAVSGGGGGGTYVPPAPAAPATPGGTDLVAEPGRPPREEGINRVSTGDTTLEGLTSDQIEQTMRAIEAQYGLTREQLLNDRSMAGLAYRRLESELKRAREFAGAQAEEGALRRGILRSGIYAEQQGDLSQQFAEQQAAAATERQARINAINQQLAQLQAQQEAEKAAEAARIRRQNLGNEQTATVV